MAITRDEPLGAAAREECSIGGCPGRNTGEAGGACVIVGTPGLRSRTVAFDIARPCSMS